MKNNSATILSTAALSLFVMAGDAIAQDLKVDTYTEPKPVKQVSAAYPSRALSKGEAGWVEISMMIDASGKPFEIAALNVSGDKDFAKAAISALEKWEFEPAMSNGKPITGSTRLLYRFTLGGGDPGARKAFIMAHSSFLEAVKTKPKEESEARLKDLEEVGAKNNYERAYLSLAHYRFASKYESQKKQIGYLNDALSYSTTSKDQVYLTYDEAKFARREYFRLLVNNKLYAEAKASYQYFAAVDDRGSVNEFKPVMDKLTELEAGESIYEIPLVLGEYGDTHFLLFKHKVYVTAVEGRIYQFKALCKEKYVGFDVEPDIEYSIPKEWGDCRLRILGDAGTKFKLGQQ